MKSSDLQAVKCIPLRKRDVSSCEMCFTSCLFSSYWSFKSHFSILPQGTLPFLPPSHHLRSCFSGLSHYSLFPLHTYCRANQELIVLFISVIFLLLGKVEVPRDSMVISDHRVVIKHKAHSRFALIIWKQSIKN